ncbi:DUF4349 domain-containing protein [Phenylobacterium sp.]|uniref:DUF4349 domain-containing protein n=1 Tax=Phenylobacterium sp. TaxID=1871053 RepID=UPI0027365FEE|nr:DUF4349 domain-containing protein [Phenylobacterium sp.]MDP3661130.1 DUF4349 domain-containing protein [Phenylobacterium sp.]
MRIANCLVIALALTACSRPSGTQYRNDLTDVALIKPANAAPETTAPAPFTPMLAYRYRYAVFASADSVRALIARHESRCAAAGPTTCQVVLSSVTDQGPGDIVAKLLIRATPVWVEHFRSGVDGETKDVGGKLGQTLAESEDISRPIIDNDATLRAKTTLRDRLQRILDQRPAKISDMLEVERELARVQGELDVLQSELTMMRSRVATSEIEIHYRSAGMAPPAGVRTPLSLALRDMPGIVVETLATILRVIAAAVPWALIGGVLWLFRKRLPRWRGKKSTPTI